MRNRWLTTALVSAVTLATASTGSAQWNTADPSQTSKQAHRGMFGDRRMGLPLQAPQSQFRSGLQRGPSGDFYGRAPLDRPMMFSPRMAQSPLLPPLNQQQLSGTQALDFANFLDAQQRIQYPGQTTEQMQTLLQAQQNIAGTYLLQQNTLAKVQQQELPEQRLQRLQQQLQEVQQQATDQQDQIAQQQQVAELSRQIAEQQQAIIQAQQAALQAAEQQRAALEAAQQQQPQQEQQEQQQAPPGQPAPPEAAPTPGAAASPDIWFRGTPATGQPGAMATPPQLAPAAAPAANVRPVAPRVAAFSAPVPGSDARSLALARRISSTPGLHARSPIAVSIANGTATLQGTVASPHDRQMAELTTLLEPGVDRVNNRLMVQP